MLFLDNHDVQVTTCFVSFQIICVQIQGNLQNIIFMRLYLIQNWKEFIRDSDKSDYVVVEEDNHY